MHNNKSAHVRIEPCMKGLDGMVKHGDPQLEPTKNPKSENSKA